MDIVVLWVDGADPVWRKKKNDFLVSIGEKPLEDTKARYRDWGVMRYWFRAVEENMPWVERVFFVSDDQVPPWLNIAHPKLRVIRHADFIPQEYLPCFSSRAIELNLFRIPELSEEFLLFNDDFFLNAPAKPTDFFRDGLPCLTYAEDLFIQKTSSFYFYALFNNMTIVNRHFAKRTIVKRTWRKILSPRNGTVVLKNLLLLPFSGFGYLRSIHSSPYPMRKSTMAEIWMAENEILDKTCRQHFRSYGDVNQHLITAWEEARGSFFPTPIRSSYYNFSLQNSEQWSRDILQGKKLALCLNDPCDSCQMTDLEVQQLRAKLQEVFSARYPHPSHFEKDG